MRTLGQRRPPSLGLLLTAAILLAAAPGAHAAELAERTLEGRVAVARGRPLAVEVGGGVELVDLVPGASMLGFTDVYELRPGDRVRVTWSRESAGIKLAEVIEADPIVHADVGLAVLPDVVAEAILAGNAPVLLDARSDAAFAAGHLPGARVAGRVDVAELPAGAAVVVYGESGRTGEGWAAARRLIARERREVRVLGGGLQGWIGRDRPLEVAPEAAAAALRGSAGWVVVDVRPAAKAVEARIPGSVSSPAGAFQWRDFDGTTPLRPVLLVGTDAADRSPWERAEQIRKLRSQAQVKPALRMAVLAGGFDAWRGAGLPVEKGGAPPATAPFRALYEGEISPEEFRRRFEERGTGVTYLDVRRNGPVLERVVSIPLEDLAARMRELPGDREVVVFCTVGERSRVAAELLKRNGYRARFLRAGSGY